MSSIDNYQDSAQLFRYAVSLEPGQVFEDTGRPLPSRLASTVSDHVSLSFLTESNIEPSERSQTILRLGIEQSFSALDIGIGRTAPSMERTREFLHSHKTLMAIANLAMNKEESLFSIINTIARESDSMVSPVRYNEYSNCLVISRPNNIEEQGCPYAKPLGKSESELNPLFSKFVIWTGELAARSVFNTRFGLDYAENEKRPN